MLCYVILFAPKGEINHPFGDFVHRNTENKQAFKQ